MPPQIVSQPLSVNVLAAAVVPLVMGTNVLPNAQEGIPYSQQLSVSGGTSPYTWSIIAGALPTGLSMDSTGLITGTPTVASAVVGGVMTPFSFTAQVVDSGV